MDKDIKGIRKEYSIKLFLMDVCGQFSPLIFSNFRQIKNIVRFRKGNLITACSKMIELDEAIE